MAAIRVGTGRDDGPLSVVAVGIGRDDGEPLSLIEEKDWKEMWPGKDLNWDSERVPVRLMVELPFWLMLPDCEISVAHDRATVTASVRGSFVEVMKGPCYFDSHLNFVQMASEIDLNSEPVQQGRAGVNCPVFRPLKTVVI